MAKEIPKPPIGSILRSKGSSILRAANRRYRKVPKFVRKRKET